MKALARFSYSHRRQMLLGWLALLVVLFAACAAGAGDYKTDFKLPGSESQAALDLLKAKGVNDRTGFSGQVVFRADKGINDPAVKSTMEKFFADLQAKVPDTTVKSPYDPANAYQVSKDGKIAYAEANLADRNQEGYRKAGDTVKELRKEVHQDGLEIELGGDIFADQPEFSSEFIGVIAAVVILLVAFGSVLAMGLPIITALFGIGSGAALIGLFTRVMNVPDFTTQVAAMIGIGVGIDYALLIVSRYRTTLHEGSDPESSVTLAIDTSGRAVLFAG